MSPPDTTLFEDAIDVPLWLEADRDTPHLDRARRERKISSELSVSDDVARVRGWWRTVMPETGSGAGSRLDRLRTLLALLMIALGVFAGVSLALVAFRYDGSQPVNVVRLLGLLVGLQLLFLLATLLLLLIPGRASGFGGVRDLLSALNPGAWAASLFARFARAGINLNLLDRPLSPRAARFGKWQVLVWSQLAAVMFNVAVLATAIALVTFTDLAFGWSTTLSVDSANVARIVHAIAWPWQGIVPSAVPDADLVAQSQFFRLDSNAEGVTVAADSRALAGWWPFTLFAIVVYGLLPRIVLLAIAVRRLHSATRNLLLDDPRVIALIDRMTTPVIETGADSHDETRAPGEARARGLEPAPGGHADAVVWEGAVAPDAARQEARRRFGTELDRILEAGGATGLEGDKRTLESLDRRPGGTLLVFTPAWEPPVLEVLDFLKAVRDRIGDGMSIVVVPLADGDRAVTELELETWKRGLGRLEDPRLYVEVGSQ